MRSLAHGFVAREPAAADRIGGRIPLENEPLPAALNVLPKLAMGALRVVEEEQLIVPGLEVAAAVRRPHLGRIAAVAKLGVVARAAVRTGNSQHRLQPRCRVIACMSTARCRTHRSRCCARSGRAPDDVSADARSRERSCAPGTSPPPASPLSLDSTSH